MRSRFLILLFLHVAVAQQPWTRNAARVYCGDNGTLPYAAQVDPAGGIAISCEYPPCSGDTDQALQLGYSNLGVNTYYTGGYSQPASAYDFITEITPSTAYGGRYLATVYRMGCVAAVAAPVAEAAPVPVAEAGGYSGGYYYNPFGNVQCFSGDTLVQTPAGEKPIRDVDVDDLLLSTEAGVVQYSRVLMHLHKVHDVKTEFVHVQLSSGRDLKLTDYHLVYASEDCRGVDREVMYAKDLKEGMCVLAAVKRITHGSKTHRVGKLRVLSVDRVTERGYYAPLTGTGDIVVNGVVASCHSNFAARTLQQSLLRMWDFLEPIVHAFAMTSSESTQWSMLGNALMAVVPSPAMAKFL